MARGLGCEIKKLIARGKESIANCDLLDLHGSVGCSGPRNLFTCLPIGKPYDCADERRRANWDKSHYRGRGGA